MKVIELLNKIASGKEPPKRIKWQGKIYTYNGVDYNFGADYIENYVDLDYENGYILGIFHLMESVALNEKWLNKDVEIIEDTPKIKKIDVNELQTIKKWKRAKVLGNKLNEIIDYINDKGE